MDRTLITFLAFACTPLVGAAALAQTEDFNGAGSTMAGTLFPDVISFGGGTFERQILAAGMGAPNTLPPLPINDAGDKEARYFEVGFAPASSALTADLPENIVRNQVIDGYVGIAYFEESGSRHVGFVLRADATPELNAYRAAITHLPDTGAAVLTIVRVRDGVVTPPDSFVTSQEFVVDPDVENYRLVFSAQGDTLSASLSRVTAAGGAIVETPIDLLADPGVQSTLTATDAELRRGRAGLSAFARGDDSVFFDNVTLSPAPCVNFDAIALGTEYGNCAGDAPGDVIFTDNAVEVSVDDFHFPVGGTFGCASVVVPFGGFGGGRIVGTNNINLTFDFSAFGFADAVRFEFADLGGFENIGVNGDPVCVGELTAAAPCLLPSGVILTVVTDPMLGGVRGTATLTGVITSLTVGGQEFWLDSLCARPAEICPCDWTADGAVNSDDYFAFLDDYFGGSADFDADGVTNSNDYFAFLDCYFNPCP
jgi:hypothetical protein